MSYQPTMLQAYCEWTMLRAAWKARAILPKSTMESIVRFGGSLACALGSTMKGKTAEKYQRLLGDCATEQRCQVLCEGMIANFLRTLLEQSDIEKMLRAGPREFVQFPHLERLDAGLAAGKGVVLASVHLGNWEVGGSALALLGYPLKVVAWKARNILIENHLQKLRRKTGMTPIFPDTQAQMHIYRCLKQNCPVAFALDLGEWERGIPVKFCGNDYLFPRGPLFFAQRTGAQLIPAVSYRDEKAKLNLLFEKPLDIDPRDESEEYQQATMQRLADVLEVYVKAHPDQWLWVPSDGDFIEEMRQNGS